MPNYRQIAARRSWSCQPFLFLIMLHGITGLGDTAFISKTVYIKDNFIFGEIES